MKFPKDLIFCLVFSLSLHSCTTARPITPKTGPWYFKHDQGASLRTKVERSGQKYGVATQGSGATEASRRMFELGGNAADAATAASFAISVERPQSTGLGGGGFLLYYHPSFKKGPVAFDFREMAPAKSHAKMFLDDKGEVIPDKSLTGIHSVGVPGLVSGIIKFHRRFGVLPLSVVMAPAIAMAENGISVYPELAEAIESEAERLLKFPASKEIFLPGGQGLKVGQILIQKDLANTLRDISEKGEAGFYSGSVGRKIAKYSKSLGQQISLNDLQSYLVKERVPVSAQFGDYTLYSMAPPSSGGVHIAQIIGMSHGLLRPEKGPMDEHNIHVVASAMQMAFYDRARYLGDPDFVKVPLDTLISQNYLQDLQGRIKGDVARKGDDFAVWPDAFHFKGPKESDQTTHFSILTKDGEAVVSTQTINGHFGSAIVVPGTGVVLNNEMDDFATKVGASNLFGAIGGENNLPAAKKRPLSSMSPTLVFKKNRPILALGTPSGTRILTCVAQTVINRLIYGMDLYDSVALLRYHQQWMPDKLFVEARGLPDRQHQALTAMGHIIETKDIGCRIQAVELIGDMNDRKINAVSDPRGEGSSYAL
ncbi:MAG: gamma-glutamyltransferase [Bdellovibrio sp.]|nr:gamma-glutamyltransferase [Bdellovibrio sp.]